MGGAHSVDGLKVLWSFVQKDPSSSREADRWWSFLFYGSTRMTIRILEWDLDSEIDSSYAPSDSSINN